MNQPTRQSLRLHFKVLRRPTSFSTSVMLSSMRDVFEPQGFDVDLASTEFLDLPLLEDPDIGSCNPTALSADMVALYAHRNNAGANELVIYFVRQTINPPSNGCAAHPAGLPGAIVTSGATKWTLAHEVGHILGLPHVSDSRRLMTGNGTGTITDEPPDLTALEIGVISQSSLTSPVNS